MDASHETDELSHKVIKNIEGTHTPSFPGTIDCRYNRILTFKNMILLGLSMTIGSGIFVLIDDVAKYSHNFVWISMLTAGILSLLTALSYGELAGIFRNNMGEYGYIKAVSTPKISNIIGGVIMLSDIFIIATIALGLGNYLTKTTGGGTATLLVMSIMSIIILNYFNYCGIHLSTQISHYALYLKLAIIVMIIIFSFSHGSPQESLTDRESVTMTGFSTATIIALFAYLGFNNMTNFAEETVNPETTIGQSIVITVTIATIIYTLLALSSLYVIKSSELSQSNTPLASIVGRLFGPIGFTLTLILAVVSLFDTLLVTCVSESRYIHSYLSNVSPQYGHIDMDPQKRTPYLSILLMAGLSIMIILIFKQIGVTAIYGDVLIMLIFIVVNVIVIILRYKHPEVDRPFKIPFNVGSLPLPSVIAIGIAIYAIYQHVTKR